MTSVTDMMSAAQKGRLSEEPAYKGLRILGFPLGATPFQMTGHFHQLMGLPAPEQPIVPSVSMRVRRARLILEELQEFLDANGLQLEHKGYEGLDCTVRLDDIKVEHIEGSHYDVVECADALGDLNVVVNGTSVEYGIPQHFIDYEVYCSNLTKLGQDGKPIVNHCQRCGPDPDNVYLSTCACDSEEFWLKPGVSIGKILKPESFVPTNIARVLLAYERKEV